MDENELRLKDLDERFGAAIETWRLEVNWYWTRTAYFAVFETASLGGLWVIFKDYWFTSLSLSLLGFLLTCVWILHNYRMHEYVEEWWKRAGEIEKSFAVPDNHLLIHKFKERRNTGHCMPYHWIDCYIIPSLFMLAWLWMVGWGILRVVIYLAISHNYIHRLIEQTQ